jgi:hypothetical protein
MQPILFLASAAIIHGLGMHAAAAGLPSDVMRRPHWLSVSSAPDSTSNYTFSRHTILGPRGWDCKGAIGADGTVLVLIRSSPPEQKQLLERRTVVCEVQDGDQVERLLAESEEYLLFECSGACVGCALSVACEFFKSAAEHDVDRRYRMPTGRPSVGHFPIGFNRRIRATAPNTRLARQEFSCERRSVLPAGWRARVLCRAT